MDKPIIKTLDENGKLINVFIEADGSRCINVWSDLKSSQIAEIPGVTDVFSVSGRGCLSVYLDPRYDAEFIKGKIRSLAFE